MNSTVILVNHDQYFTMYMKIHDRNIRARGSVEQWLVYVENGMIDTVKK